MPYERLFDNDARYTAEADRLAHEIWLAISPFFRRNFCPRDVFTLISSEVVSEMSGTIVADGIARRNAQRLAEPAAEVQDDPPVDVQED